MKFKLKAGSFSAVLPDGTRKMYKTGEIVDSDIPLHKVFKNSFEYLTPLDTQAVAEAVAKVEAKQAAELEKKQLEPEPVPEPVITLKAVSRGSRKWDVLKVVDGKVSDEAVNEIYLSKRAADALVKEGWQGE